MSHHSVVIARAARISEVAAKRGWTLTRKANVCKLRDNTGVIVLQGSLRKIELHLGITHVVQHPGRRKPPLAEEWASLVDAYCRYLSSGGQTAPTVALRRSILARMARELGKPPAEVTADDLVDWFGGHPHWKPETRRSHRFAARGFLSWAYRKGHMPDYLGDDLPPVRTPMAIAKPVPDSAWHAAMDAADARERIMLRLAAEAGLRRAEVAQVRVRDVTDGPTGPQLLIHGKGLKDRIVPISDSLAELIRAGAQGHSPTRPRFGGGDWLFPSSHGTGPVTAQHVGVAISRLLPEGYSMHKLRTRFATRAFRGSRDLFAVQQLLGHASVATTERYVAIDDDSMRAAMMAAALD